MRELLNSVIVTDTSIEKLACKAESLMSFAISDEDKTSISYTVCIVHANALIEAIDSILFENEDE